MKIKVKLVILFIALNFTSPTITFIKESDLYKFHKLKLQYSWLTPDLFYIIEYESNKMLLDSKLIYAVIARESNGKNVISRMNKNKTHDYGYMQINSCHVEKGKEFELLNPHINIIKGVSYLRFCMLLSNGDIREAIRKYNQGHNGLKKNYKNWKYVDTIQQSYLASL